MGPDTRDLLEPAGRSFFKISEVALLLGKPVQTLHTWLKVGKIRQPDRLSRAGPYLIPRSEVARLLEAAGREVPGLWQRSRVRVLFIDDDPMLRELALAVAQVLLSAQTELDIAPRTPTA